jgi:RNA polymerase sigma-70 factor (ECF subfamily)
MPFASTFGRSAGAPIIPIDGRLARNDQIPLASRCRAGRQDAVLGALAEAVRNQLGTAATNDNAHPGASAPPYRARARRSDPDGDVIALIDGGNEDGALRQLMARHGNAVWRYCRDELRDAALADDVKQQVFIEAFRDLRNFQRRATVKVWLFAIARHRVLDAAKKRRSARNYFAETGAVVLDAVDAAPTAAEALDEARLHAALLDAVDELPDSTRMALLLHYEHGLTFAEIARVCRERSGTLCARVARAMPLLRRRIEARLGIDTASPARRTRAGSMPC